MSDIRKDNIDFLSGINSINSIESVLRSKGANLVEYISNLHPMLKMYFDSELSSEIEDNTLLAITEALVSSVNIVTEKGTMKTYRTIGISLAQTLSKRMYFAKLIHHANSERITMDQFYEFASAYIAAESVNVINQLWDTLGLDIPQYFCSGIEKVLPFLGIQPETAKYISDILSGICEVAYSYVKSKLTVENIKKIVYGVLKFTIQTANKLIEFADRATKKVKAFYRRAKNKVKGWGRDFCELLGLNVPDFLKEKDVDSKDSGKKDVHIDDGIIGNVGTNADDVIIDKVDENVNDVIIDKVDENVDDVIIDGVIVKTGIQTQKENLNDKNIKKANIEVDKYI